MDGMILAAGLGTRLRPLTDHLPKALVPVAGVPMLERIARRLVEAGVDRLVINVHHHADQVRSFVAERDGFGVDARISDEPGAALETGGGLLHARHHFRGDAPFFLHNVDVVSDVDLAGMYRGHQEAGALATLAVSDRPSSRRLEFDGDGLCGWVDTRSGDREPARPPRGPVTALAFNGIHVISPELLELIDERGAFSILKPYLRLAGAGHVIRPYHMGPALWLEVGDPDRLERARQVMEGRGDAGAEGGPARSDEATRD
jgi:N-acetyl-alpha-D-muramate 1-phosphate uridylyltransferase